MSTLEPRDILGRPGVTRRNFLYATTAALGGAGILAASWPLIDQMNPDARVRAAGDVVAVNLADLRPAEQRLLHWHSLPIFVVERTQPMLDAMRGGGFAARLIDPESRKRQQPSYAKNWHRSIEPAYAVLVGVCTACGCVPRYFADASALNVAGGYICPCCASRYDAAGRVYSGIAAYNLPVPPYSVVAPATLLIGRNATDELFRLESVERI